MLGIGTLVRKVFGSPSDKVVKSARQLVTKINALEPQFKDLSDQGLKDKTQEFKDRYAKGESLDALLPEAFANCREAARRTLGLRAFDVQLIAGVILHRGNIAEMKTGEGKTLMATFPAYLNAIPGKGVHVVTVNDYLAKRDAGHMGKVFAALGMTTSVVYPQQPENEKKAAYAADITYATNNELGFDYLRDNMKSDLAQMNQRPHFFAVVDEVDSILIDEARTPLIISGPAQDRSELYKSVDVIVPELQPEHYTVDEKARNVTFTDEGNDFLETRLVEAGILPAGQSLYDPESTTIVHHVNQGLRAHILYHKDKDYIVRDDEIVLIDEFTGRMMAGRRLSEGLHQALEAKEGVKIQPENVTLAQVTFQNYFRLYEKLSGMTGTAMTEAEEFGQIYGLGVVEVPTNRPVARKDEHDQVYRTAKDKYAGIVKEIAAAHAKGQPVLVGTTSIEKSEMLSALLKQAGIPHNVLNARQHAQEAQIVADAGLLGAVTIATNMAGRGTDIQLGGNVDLKILDALAANPEANPDELRAQIEAEHAAEKEQVRAAGGLFVLGTERHETRRIDNQLRGRSGRQGDPGRSVFFLSLEDDLMRIFGSEKLDSVLTKLGMKEGEAIVHPWVNKSLERAQAKVEGRNFDIRKQLLKFDDVMNDQRKVVFSQRREIMEAQDLGEIVADMRAQLLEDTLQEFMPAGTYPDQWDGAGLKAALFERANLDLPVEDWLKEENIDSELVLERVISAASAAIAEKVEAFGAENWRNFEKQVVLQAIDGKWREHLLKLEHLRSVVGFRGYAQRDPLNEYKNESFQLFETMLESLRGEVTQKLGQIRPMSAEERQAMMTQMIEEQQRRQAEQAAQQARAQAMAAAAAATAAALTPREGFNPEDPATWGNPSRNDPCPCGSGERFKNCHGAF